MASLLIKNVPEDLHKKLRERAAREHRSLNMEVIVLIEHALGTRLPVALPEPLPLRRPIDTRTLLRARREGRA